MRTLSVALVLVAGIFTLTRVLPAQVTRELRLPLKGGKLSLLALGRALLDEYGYRGDALEFPDVAVDVTGVKGTLLLAGISRTLLRTTRFAVVDRGETLRLRIDRARVRAVRHKIKRRVGTALSVLVGRDLLVRSYELVVPEGLGRDESFVLLVHGVDSSPATFGDLRRFLAAGDDPVKIGTFAYANDEAIDRIGDQLAARLKKQAKDCPDRDIILVAHSMGGLVARYMLETPGVDPGNVSTLIMLATPNHGSRLSRLRPGVDLLTFLRRHGDDARLVAPINDGMGEAGFDMWPDSPFLTILNRRPRNPAVTYHLILGDKGILSAARMREFREQIMNKVRRLKKQEIYAQKIAAWLDDLHEVLQGEGDGAVSLRRGSLAGVEPVVLPFGHLGMLRSAAPRQRQPVFAQVLVWVEAAR